MKFSVAALLLLIAVVFASMDLIFFAFVVVVILAFLAVTDAVPAAAAGAAGGEGGSAAGASGSGVSSRIVKRVTITSDSGKKTKITDAVDKDELKWAPPGKPSDWGKTSYEEFGSGLAQTVFLPLKVAKRALGWILR